MINFILGIVLITLGAFGTPSPLDEQPNTATLVYLTGIILFSIGFNGLL